MAEAEKAQLLQTTALFLIIAGIILVILAIILLIEANGGIKSLKDKFKKNHPYQSKNIKMEEGLNKNHIVKRRQEVYSRKQNISAIDKIPMRDRSSTKNIESIDDMSETQPLIFDIRQSIHNPDKLTPVKKYDNSYSKDEDETTILENQVASNKFRIIKKIVITHENKKEK